VYWTLVSINTLVSVGEDPVAYDHVVPRSATAFVSKCVVKNDRMEHKPGRLISSDQLSRRSRVKLVLSTDRTERSCDDELTHVGGARQAEDARGRLGMKEKESESSGWNPAKLGEAQAGGARKLLINWIIR
jgi:hypothetical protein